MPLAFQRNAFQNDAFQAIGPDYTNIFCPILVTTTASSTQSISIARMYYIPAVTTPGVSITWTAVPVKFPSTVSVPWGEQTVTNPIPIAVPIIPMNNHYVIDDLPPNYGVHETKDWEFNYSFTASISAGLGNTWTGILYARVAKYSTNAVGWTLLSPTNIPTLDWQLLTFIGGATSFTCTPANSPLTLTGQYTFTPSTYILNGEEIGIELRLDVIAMVNNTLANPSATITINQPVGGINGTYMLTGHQYPPFFGQDKNFLRGSISSH